MDPENVWLVYRLRTDKMTGKISYFKPVEYRKDEEQARRVQRLFDLQLPDEFKSNTVHRTDLSLTDI